MQNVNWIAGNQATKIMRINYMKDEVVAEILK
jgi:hypothetical protein